MRVFCKCLSTSVQIAGFTVCAAASIKPIVSVNEESNSHFTGAVICFIKMTEPHSAVHRVMEFVMLTLFAVRYTYCNAF